MKENLVHQLLLFFGLVLVLMGIAGAARIGVNIVAFEKYPFDGVIPANILISSNTFYPTYQKESDCSQTYPYYTPDGVIRPATPEEKQANEENEKKCLSSIAQDRTRARNIDIGLVSFVLIVGLGLLAARRIK